MVQDGRKGGQKTSEGERRRKKRGGREKEGVNLEWEASMQEYVSVGKMKKRIERNEGDGEGNGKDTEWVRRGRESILQLCLEFLRTSFAGSNLG